MEIDGKLEESSTSSQDATQIYEFKRRDDKEPTSNKKRKTRKDMKKKKNKKIRPVIEDITGRERDINEETNYEDYIAEDSYDGDINKEEKYIRRNKKSQKKSERSRVVIEEITRRDQTNINEETNNEDHVAEESLGGGSNEEDASVLDNMTKDDEVWECAMTNMAQRLDFVMETMVQLRLQPGINDDDVLLQQVELLLKSLHIRKHYVMLVLKVLKKNYDSEQEERESLKKILDLEVDHAQLIRDALTNLI